MRGSKRFLIAIGGNSIIKNPLHTSIADQYACIVETAEKVCDLVTKGFSIAVVHGNGPQVGFGMTRNEAGIKYNAPDLPLDVIDAQTEGQLGYLLQQALHNCMVSRGKEPRVASIITQVQVSETDEAFANPTKPVGSFFSESEAQEKIAKLNWKMIEQKQGWRRCVASPKPIRIVEQWAIEKLMELNSIVICLGGGGVPVFENKCGQLKGVPAVIDKDAAASLLAQQLNFDGIIFSTGVPSIFLDFNTRDQQRLEHMSIDTAQTYLNNGQFPPGSMGPKVEAAISFLSSDLQNKHRKCWVTDPYHISDVILRGKNEAGTTITS